MSNINKAYYLHLKLILFSFSVIFISLLLSYFYLNNNLKTYNTLFSKEVKKHHLFNDIENNIKNNKKLNVVLNKNTLNSKDYFFIKNELKLKLKYIENNNSYKFKEVEELIFEYKKSIQLISNITKNNKLFNNNNIQNIIKSSPIFNYNSFYFYQMNFKKIEIQHNKYIESTKLGLNFICLIFIVLVFLLILNVINCRKRKKFDHYYNKQIFKYKNILNTTPNALLILNEKGNIIEYNKQFLNLSGYSSTEIKNSNYKKYLPLKEIEKLINYEYTKEEIQFLYLFKECTIKNKKNKKIKIEYSISISENTFEDENETLYLIVLRDVKEITTLVNENIKLQNLANKDPLTGIYNRRYILNKTKELFTQLYFNKPFTVLALDLDYFKNVNDNYGHDTGDFVLKEFVKMLNEEIREHDIFGRIGGEEFLIIISGLNEKTVNKIAERIKSKIENKVFKYKEKEIKITLSIGGYHINALIDTSLEDCINHADKALYEAKNTGRNKVVFFDKKNDEED